MEYIEWMNNLRHALDVVKKVMPEVNNVAHMKAALEKDDDLKIALMPDEVWYELQNKYEEVEAKLYQFNPEEEYGVERR